MSKLYIIRWAAGEIYKKDIDERMTQAALCQWEWMRLEMY